MQQTKSRHQTDSKITHLSPPYCSELEVQWDYLDSGHVCKVDQQHFICLSLDQMFVWICNLSDGR